MKSTTNKATLPSTKAKMKPTSSKNKPKVGKMPMKKMGGSTKSKNC